MVMDWEVKASILLFSISLVQSLPLGSLSSLDGVEDGIWDDEDTRYLSNGINHLNKNLFKILSSGNDSNQSNLLISPYSIHTAMSMLYRGSEGETKRQLEAALGVEKADPVKLLQENKNQLNNYSLNTEIQVANSLFADDTFNIKENYQHLLQEFYLTKVQTVDFEDNSKTVDTINEWVKTKTKNLIDSLVDSVSSETRMLLLNAVYFKANWLIPFEKELTSKRSFHLSPTKSVETDFMFLEDSMEFATLEDLNADVVSLPYQDQNFRMLIFLPYEGSTIKNMETKLFDSTLDTIDDFLFPQLVLLSLPKFKISYAKSLIKSFQQLGVTDVFDDADLSIISDEPLFVSDIVHKASVEVTEEGSEAAAVTGVFIQGRSGFLENVMDVNRPFIFVIQDKTQNIPLFVGKINDPADDKLHVEHHTEDQEIKNINMGKHLAHDEDLEVVPKNIDILSDNYLKENAHFFPLNNKDTDPILYYKTKFGDGSIYGNRGDMANKENKVDEYETENEDYGSGEELSLRKIEELEDSNEGGDIVGLKMFDINETLDSNNSVEESSNEEFIESGRLMHYSNDIFPVNNTDTEPILHYKDKFGDGSIYGYRGELANQNRNQLF